jgi:exodeoxyribonuclease VII large subunit
VSQITQRIKAALEEDPSLQDVWVQGEISNWFRSRAGHCYFTLKDAQATIRVVIWRMVAEQLGSVGEDGQSVLAHGYVSVYEPQGQYQFYVDELTSTGRGLLYLEFERLKDRLAGEGLFDPERKRPLPAFPACIGVVTSPLGAALRDIQHVLGRRWPLVRMLLSPTLVQGEAAPEQIVAALRAVYERDDVDVILLARGGGSLEHLWAFNDERVARTIVESPVPVITGIGHETDYTIADFVADRRAPTPSAAAEIAVPDQGEIREQLGALSVELEEVARRRIDERRRTLDTHLQGLARLSPRLRIDRERQVLDELVRRAEQVQRHRLALLREQVSGAEQRLRGLDPQATLTRGYAVVRREDGQVIRQVTQAVQGERITVRVSDGDFGARVEG